LILFDSSGLAISGGGSNIGASPNFVVVRIAKILYNSDKVGFNLEEIAAITRQNPQAALRFEINCFFKSREEP